jgi:glycerol-3-phosphate dehydrogenase (NAD(P)+)
VTGPAAGAAASAGDALGIVGGGAFALALASLASGTGRNVLVFGGDRRAGTGPPSPAPAPAPAARHLAVPTVRFAGDARELAQSARLLVLAVPSPRLPATLAALAPVLDGHHVIVHALGALASGTAAAELRVSEVVRASTCVKRIGVIAGPAFAADLTARRPCAVVAASGFDEVVRLARERLAVAPVLRVYGSRDLAGVELAAALSGAMSVAVGLADGLDVGAGPRAVLITRALAEMTRLGRALGAEAASFHGLAGLGNLLVCTSSAASEHSADYQFGLRVARAGAGGTGGASGAGATGDVPEGARTAAIAAALASRLSIHAPILGAVDGVLRLGTPPAAAAEQLLSSVAAEE